MNKERLNRRENRLPEQTYSNFLKAVIENQAKAKQTKIGDFFQEAGINVRDQNITALSTGTRVSYREIGEVYGISRQRVHQIIQTTIEKLYKRSSAAIQEQFDPSQLHLSHNQRSRKSSAAQNDQANQAERMLKGGASLEEVHEKINWTPAVRQTLIGRGINPQKLSLQETNHHRQQAENLRRDPLERNKEEIQKLLDIVSFKFYAWDRRQENPSLVSIKQLVADYHHSPRYRQLFVKYLLKVGIPVGVCPRIVHQSDGQQKTLRYHFIRNADYRKAREALSKSTLSASRQRKLPK